MFKFSSKKLISLALSLLLSGVIQTSLVFADNIVVDGDGDKPIAQMDINLGDIPQGSVQSGTALIGIIRNGNANKNVFENGALVTISVDSISSDVQSVFEGSNTIQLPANWETIGNNVVAGEVKASWKISVGADAQIGEKTATIVYKATGPSVMDGTITERTDELIIKYTVVENSLPTDTTNPNLDYEITPAAPDGSNGWYKSPVQVKFTYSDIGSGIDETTIPSDENYSTDGIYPSKTYTIKDNAGNSASVTVPEIKIDKTAPEFSVLLEKAAPDGENGWYVSSVGVDFTASDNGSGLSLPVPEDYELSDDGVYSGKEYTIKDKAGNSASVTVPEIKIDKTAPEFSVLLEKAAPDGENGWYVSSVGVDFTASDIGSGLSLPVPEDYELLDDGVYSEKEYTIKDFAGNISTVIVPEIKIDKTAPVVLINSPIGGKIYKIDEVVLADWSASDALSGISSAVGSVPTGNAIDTGSIGNKVFSVEAEDKAGNVTNTSVEYKVIYNFNGFFQPVDMNGVLNVAKAGSSIPIKFSLNGYKGMDILSGAPKVAPYSCPLSTPTDSIITSVTAGGSTLSYDPLTDQYIYVWKTDKIWAGSCKKFVLTLNDGMSYEAYFKFK